MANAGAAVAARTTAVKMATTPAIIRAAWALTGLLLRIDGPPRVHCMTQQNRPNAGMKPNRAQDGWPAGAGHPSVFAKVRIPASYLTGQGFARSPLLKFS
jgi:hypothetical protein